MLGLCPVRFHPLLLHFVAFPSANIPESVSPFSQISLALLSLTFHATEINGKHSYSTVLLSKHKAFTLFLHITHTKPSDSPTVTSSFVQRPRSFTMSQASHASASSPDTLTANADIRNQRQASVTAVSTVSVPWTEEGESSPSFNAPQASTRATSEASYLPRSCMKNSRKNEAKVNIDDLKPCVVGR
jgi:hypothetical protein